MECLQENNIEKKRLENRKNCRQLEFAIRERRRPRHKGRLVPLVKSALGGGIKEILNEIENFFKKDL